MTGSFFQAVDINLAPQSCSFFVPTSLGDGSLVRTFNIIPFGLDG